MAPAGKKQSVTNANPYFFARAKKRGMQYRTKNIMSAKGERSERESVLSANKNNSATTAQVKQSQTIFFPSLAETISVLVMY
jgi:hypothetical protein